MPGGIESLTRQSSLSVPFHLTSLNPTPPGIPNLGSPPPRNKLINPLALNISSAMPFIALPACPIKPSPNCAALPNKLLTDADGLTVLRA